MSEKVICECCDEVIKLGELFTYSYICDECGKTVCYDCINDDCICEDCEMSMVEDDEEEDDE